MKKIIINLVIILFLFSLHCSNENTIFDPTLWSKTFKGITFTDENGNVLGGDLSDWCYQGDNGSSNSGTVPMRFGFGPAYPNPVERANSMTVTFPLAKSSFCHLYVINGDLITVKTLITGILPAGLHSVRWNLDNNSEIKLLPGVYRMIFETDVFNCHGDIWIQ